MGGWCAVASRGASANALCLYIHHATQATFTRQLRAWRERPRLLELALDPAPRPRLSAAPAVGFDCSATVDTEPDQSTADTAKNTSNLSDTSLEIKVC